MTKFLVVMPAVNVKEKLHKKLGRFTQFNLVYTWWQCYVVSHISKLSRAVAINNNKPSLLSPRVAAAVVVCRSQVEQCSFMGGPPAARVVKWWIPLTQKKTTTMICHWQRALTKSTDNLLEEAPGKTAIKETYASLLRLATRKIFKNRTDWMPVV